MNGGEFLRTDVKEVRPLTENRSFRDIKPEKQMSPKELKGAVNSEVDKAGKEAENQNFAPRLTDDNGVKFREGDTLLPDKEFEVNGYKYKTDALGRVVSAEGQLQIKDHEGRRPLEPRSVVGKGEMRDSDDRGHIFADRFNGSGGLENLVPMDRELNQHGDYMKMENTLADAMKDGAKVELKVEPVYVGNSTRPSEFKVSYSIDGEKEIAVFKNEREAEV